MVSNDHEHDVSQTSNMQIRRRKNPVSRRRNQPRGFDASTLGPRVIVYGLTVGTSVNALMRGQLRWMKDRGWDVHVISSPGPQLDAAQKREGFHAHPVEMQREISPVKDLRSLLDWIRELRRIRPDTVSAGTPKAALLGMTAACALRIPHRIYVVRGLRLEGTTGVKRHVLWMAEKLTIALATDVVAVSPSLRTELHSLRLMPRHGVVVIGDGSSNGVDAEAVAARATEESRAERRNEAGIAANDVVVGFLGRITADKGLDTLAAAFERSPIRDDSHVHLLCVGDVEDTALQARLNRLGERCTLIPHSPDAWSWLAAMDVLCLPTRREGFPNVVLEAAAAGLPTVTTTATGARDSVIDHETGRLVPVDDPTALSLALHELVTDEKLRHKLGAAAAERVRRDFNPERIWSGLEAMYLSAPGTTQLYSPSSGKPQ